MKTRSIINPTYLLRYAILKLTVLKLIFRAHESNSILTLLTSIPEFKIGFILHAVQENQEKVFLRSFPEEQSQLRRLAFKWLNNSDSPF